MICNIILPIYFNRVLESCCRRERKTKPSSNISIVITDSLFLFHTFISNPLSLNPLIFIFVWSVSPIFRQHRKYLLYIYGYLLGPRLRISTMVHSSTPKVATNSTNLRVILINTQTSKSNSWSPSATLFSKKAYRAREPMIILIPKDSNENCFFFTLIALHWGYRSNAYFLLKS